MKYRNFNIDKQYILLFIFSFAVLLFCSATSPIYNGHDWTDANTYLTMARGLLNGRVPYLDLFDHKGPILYFIYAAGAIVDPNGFLGVFILQVLAMSFTLLFIYKIFMIYTSSRNLSLIGAFMLPIFLLTSGIYYLPQKLDYGGGSAEEFCVPFFAFSIWIVTKNLSKHSHNWEMYDFFFIGAAIGVVFQIKFNLTLFFGGLLLPIAIDFIIKRKFRNLFVVMSFVFSGLVLTVLPYLIYAIATKSVSHFFEAYIFFNKSYAFKESMPLFVLFKHIILQGLRTFLSTPKVSATILGSLIGLLCMKGPSILWRLSILCSMVFTGISVFAGQVMPYTLLPLLLYSFCITLAILARLKVREYGEKTVQAIMICTAGLIFACTIFSNKMVFYKDFVTSSAMTCQQQISQIVKQGPFQQPTLLEAGMLNRGFYNNLGIIPSIYYFYLPNVSYDQHPEILDSQIDAILCEKTDYVVLQWNSKDLTYSNIPNDNAYSQLYSAAFNHYKLVSIIRGTGAVEDLYYYLFMRRM